MAEPQHHNARPTTRLDDSTGRVMYVPVPDVRYHVIQGLYTVKTKQIKLLLITSTLFYLNKLLQFQLLIYITYQKINYFEDETEDDPQLLTPPVNVSFLEK